MLEKFISIVMFIINGTTALRALLASYHKEGTINTYQLKVNQFEPNVVSVHLTLLSEEAPLLVYHFWSIFLINFSVPHLPSVSWCSLVHFVHSLAGDAPFGRGGTLPLVAGDAPFSHGGCSLGLLGTLPSVAGGSSLQSQGDTPFGLGRTLPSVAGDTPFGCGGCSLQSRGYAPFGHGGCSLQSLP